MGNQLGNNGGRFYSTLNRPVLLDCSFIVDSANGNGLGIRSLKGQGVKNVFMHTSSTAGKGPNGYLNPNPLAGYALIQLDQNYGRYAGGFNGNVSPLTGANLAINGSALTAHTPYVITAVGAGTKGAVTIAPVADSSGSLASTYFTITDSYGNQYVVWFSVSGVGAAPVGVAGILVQQSIVTNDTAATIGADLVITLGALLAAQPGNLGAPSGVYSFTAAGTTTVTVTNTASTPFPGGPADGAIATGFTFAVTKDQTNLQNWQAVGLPKGIVPAVGAAFIATATGYSSRGGSTGTVKLATVSGVCDVEVIGDPNQTLAPIPMGGTPNFGGWIIVQFLAPAITMASYTPAGTITNGTPDTFAGTPAVLTGTNAFVPTAPADNTVVGMSFYVDVSSTLIAGD